MTGRASSVSIKRRGIVALLTLAARALAGKRIAPGVRLMIAPGSEASSRRMLDDGLMKVFVEAGAVMLPAGCGVCNDGVIGPVDGGQTIEAEVLDGEAGGDDAVGEGLFEGLGIEAAEGG